MTKCAFSATIRSLKREFLGEIVDQQRPAMRDEILRLGVGLLLHLVGQMAGRPDLAVRMRVGAAHDLAAVLENLYGSDIRPAAERDRLLDPGVHHPLDVGDLHHGDREIMARREAQHAADAELALGDRRPLSVRASGASGARAAKSLSNTKVCA